MTDRIDLHVHTLMSDGSDSPTAVVEKAARLGLRAIAITDHDTFSGIDEATEAGKRLGVEVVPGVELSTMHDGQHDSWVGKIHWRRDRLPIPVFLGFTGGSAGKESTRNAGDLGSIPGLGRSLAEGNSYPLQYSGLENSMDCIVHEVAKSQTQLSNFHFIFCD